MPEDSPFTGYASQGFSDADRYALEIIIAEVPVRQEIDPEAMLADDLYRGLDLVCRAIGCFRKAESRLRVALGKMLDAASKHPEFWKSRGYKTFNEFLKQDLGPKIGLGRTVLYDALSVVRSMPFITPDLYEQLGPTKVGTMKEFAPPSLEGCQPFIAKALEVNAMEFEAWATEQKLIENGEATPKTIMLRTNLAVYNCWIEFVSDPRVQSVVGSGDHGRILAAMIAECVGEWLNQGENDAVK